MTPFARQAAIIAFSAALLTRISFGQEDERSRVVGVVLDDAGIPVVGADVTLDVQGALAGHVAGLRMPTRLVGSARSDDRGNFAIDVLLPAGSIVRARASASGHEPVAMVVSTTTAVPQKATPPLTLHRLCAASLRVESAAGTPVRESVIYVTRGSAMEGPWDLTGTGSVKLTSDGSGVAEADGLRVGERHWAFAWSRGVGVSRPVAFVPTEDPRGAAATLRLGEFCAIDLHPVYENGAIVHDVRAISTALLDATVDLALSREGSTGLTGLRPGASVLLIAGSGVSPVEKFLDLVPGETTHERVVLARATERSAMLTDAAGSPVAGRLIVVTPEDPDLLAGPLLDAAPSDASGRFDIDPSVAAHVLVADGGEELPGAWWARARQVGPLQWIVDAPCVVDVSEGDAWVAVAVDPVTRLPRADFELTPLRVDGGIQLHRFGPIAFRRVDGAGRIIEVLEEDVAPGKKLELRSRDTEARRLVVKAVDSRGRRVQRFRADIVEVGGFNTPQFSEFPRVDEVTLTAVPAGRSHVVVTSPGYVAEVVEVGRRSQEEVVAQLASVGGLNVSRADGAWCARVVVEWNDGREFRVVRAARLDDGLSLMVAPGTYRVTSQRLGEQSEVHVVQVREGEVVSLVVGKRP